MQRDTVKRVRGTVAGSKGLVGGSQGQQACLRTDGTFWRWYSLLILAFGARYHVSKSISITGERVPVGVHPSAGQRHRTVYRLTVSQSQSSNMCTIIGASGVCDGTDRDRGTQRCAVSCPVTPLFSGGAGGSTSLYTKSTMYRATYSTL